MPDHAVLNARRHGTMVQDTAYRSKQGLNLYWWTMIMRVVLQIELGTDTIFIGALTGSIKLLMGETSRQVQPEGAYVTLSELEWLCLWQ